MIIQEGGFYFLSNQYFVDFPDPFLKANKQGKRPFYYCFKDKSTLLSWMIPLSSQPGKIALANKKILEGKKDLFYLTNLYGRSGVMLIADMMPITERYVAGCYMQNGVPLRYTNAAQLKEIERRSMRVLGLLRRGVKFMETQPDVFAIEEKLLKS